MVLEDILKEWETDSVIDESDLERSSVDGPRLHSKYLGLYSGAKVRLKSLGMKYDILMKDKWLYYNGKMTKEQMDERKWEYNPFNGMSKPLKGDLERFYNADNDLLKIRGQIEYQKVIVETLGDIMDNIKWRHQNIKNILAYRQFVAGV